MAVRWGMVIAWHIPKLTSMKQSVRIALCFALTVALLPSLRGQSWSRGTTLEMSYTTVGLYDMTHNRANWINVLDASLVQSLWRGGTFEANLLSVNNMRNSWGQDATVNGLTIFASIEDESIPLALFKFGIGQNSGRIRSFLGVRNVNSDYFVTPWNSIFTASVNGLFPTLSHKLPLSDSPYSALCLHVEWDITRTGLTYKSSLYNGRSATRWDEVFRFRPRRDGVINLSELSYTGAEGGYVGTYRVGVATGRALLNAPDSKTYRVSLWTLIEQPLWVAADGGGVSLILHGGYSPKCDCSGYWGAGAAWRGVFSRSDDYVGALVSRTWHAAACETDVELTYAYSWRFLTVQPAVHWVHSSGRDRWFGVLKAAVKFGYDSRN